MHIDVTLQNVLVLLTVQFAVFGWRINREIPVGEAGRRVWLPVADAVNVISMLLVLGFCIAAPLAGGTLSAPSATPVTGLPSIAREVFVAALVLLVFHPISMIAHYGLLNRNGRHSFLKQEGDDFPYWPLQERIVNIIALSAAISAACLVGG